MNTIDQSGKTVEEALKLALIELNTTIENVDFEVLEAGSRGILGFGSKLARIRVTKKFDPILICKNFLREICVCMGLVVEFDVIKKDNNVFINLKGDSIGILIGKRGQTLDALQYLTALVVNKQSQTFINVNLDAENYRKRRKETLEKLAINLAKKVKITKKEIFLESMNAYERRIIHAALQPDKTITTYSQGEEPYRYVVISLAKNKLSKN